MRQGEIWVAEQLAGILSEGEEGFVFAYREEYLRSIDPLPVSLTLPLQAVPFVSESLFPFFDGLIPEGWLLDVAHQNWKLNPRDRMGLLLKTCRDCIGNVSVVEL